MSKCDPFELLYNTSSISALTPGSFSRRWFLRFLRPGAASCLALLAARGFGVEQRPPARAAEQQAIQSWKREPPNACEYIARGWYLDLGARWVLTGPPMLLPHSCYGPQEQLSQDLGLENLRASAGSWGRVSRRGPKSPEARLMALMVAPLVPCLPSRGGVEPGVARALRGEGNYLGHPRSFSDLQ